VRTDPTTANNSTREEVITVVLGKDNSVKLKEILANQYGITEHLRPIPKDPGGKPKGLPPYLDTPDYKEKQREKKRREKERRREKKRPRREQPRTPQKATASVLRGSP
jgi:hypothetical protein